MIRYPMKENERKNFKKSAKNMDKGINAYILGAKMHIEY